MQPLLVLSILLVVLFSDDGHAGEAGHANVGTKACHLKSIPIKHQVNYLTIHPVAHVVAYTFRGRSAEPAGLKRSTTIQKPKSMPCRRDHSTMSI
jgi:hypothetical protein